MGRIMGHTKAKTGTWSILGFVEKQARSCICCGFVLVSCGRVGADPHIDLVESEDGTDRYFAQLGPV